MSMSSPPPLTPGSVRLFREIAASEGRRIFDPSFSPVVQVLDVERGGDNGRSDDRFRAKLSDRHHYVHAIFATELNDKIRDNAVVRARDFLVDLDVERNRTIVVVLEVELVDAGCTSKISDPRNVDDSDVDATPGAHIDVEKAGVGVDVDASPVAADIDAAAGTGGDSSRTLSSPTSTSTNREVLTIDHRLPRAPPKVPPKAAALSLSSSSSSSDDDDVVLVVDPPHPSPSLTNAVARSVVLVSPSPRKGDGKRRRRRGKTESSDVHRRRPRDQSKTSGGRDGKLGARKNLRGQFEDARAVTRAGAARNAGAASVEGGVREVTATGKKDYSTVSLGDGGVRVGDEHCITTSDDSRAGRCDSVAEEQCPRAERRGNKEKGGETGCETLQRPRRRRPRAAEVTQTSETAKRKFDTIDVHLTWEDCDRGADRCTKIRPEQKQKLLLRPGTSNMKMGRARLLRKGTGVLFDRLGAATTERAMYRAEIARQASAIRRLQSEARLYRRNKPTAEAHDGEGNGTNPAVADEVSSLRDKVERLRARLEESEREQERLRRETEEERRQVRELKARLREVNAAAEKANANAVERTGRVRKDVADLQSEVRTLKHGKKCKMVIDLVADDNRKDNADDTHQCPDDVKKEGGGNKTSAIKYIHDVQRDCNMKLVAIKKEKQAAVKEADDAREELETAQETAGYLIQSENNKMTQIDALKALLRQRGVMDDEILSALAIKK